MYFPELELLNVILILNLFKEFVLLKVLDIYRCSILILQDKLHDYLGVMLAVNNAFSDRANALLTVQTLLSELASLNLRIEKLEAASSKIFGGDRSRIRKIDELKETVRVTEEAKTCAVREYERIKVKCSSY